MPGKEAIPIGCSAIKPVERHGWEAVSWFLYDKNTGAIMGRTPLSWLLITIFYIIYYACLAGFWAVMLIIFFQFIDEKEPMWQQDRIGRSPALGVRPGQDWDNIDSSMLIFNKEQPKDGKTIPGYEQWVGRTNEFLEKQGYINKGVRHEKLKALGECSGEQDPSFGYSSGQPCVLLKLNKIYGLEHDYYNKSVKGMPEELGKRIDEATDKKQVWVACIGENPADEESMGGIDYFPKDGGFLHTYYPYKNQKDYLSPLVAVKFKNPPVGQFLHIECRAWAENINYHRRDRVGIAHFELMIHDVATAEKVDGTFVVKQK